MCVCAHACVHACTCAWVYVRLYKINNSWFSNAIEIIMISDMHNDLSRCSVSIYVKKTECDIQIWATQSETMPTSQ